MPRLLEEVRTAIRTCHYSPRTGEAYVRWIKRYIHFFDLRHPQELGAREAQRFLSHLATVERASASTQNQPLAPLLFQTAPAPPPYR